MDYFVFILSYLELRLLILFLSSFFNIIITIVKGIIADKVEINPIIMLSPEKFPPKYASVYLHQS